MRKSWSMVVAATAVSAAMAASAQPVQVIGLVELSGGGATAGTNFNNGDQDRRQGDQRRRRSRGQADRIHGARHADRTPASAKALTTKGDRPESLRRHGPGVLRLDPRQHARNAPRRECTNIIGGEAAAITQQGNPYVVRNLVHAGRGDAQGRALHKGHGQSEDRRGDLRQQRFRQGRPGRHRQGSRRRNGIEVVADISTDQGQVDFSGPVLKVEAGERRRAVHLSPTRKSRRALLRELRKQGYDKPIIGEIDVDERKSDRARRRRRQRRRRARRPHRRSAESDGAGIHAESFQAEYKTRPDHNAMKGYTGMHAVKAVQDKMGKIDQKAFAKTMQGCDHLRQGIPGRAVRRPLRRQGRPRPRELHRQGRERPLAGGRDVEAGEVAVAQPDRSGTSIHGHSLPRGQVAIVTGAARGIGLGIAQRLAKGGAGSSCGIATRPRSTPRRPASPRRSCRRSTSPTTRRSTAPSPRRWRRRSDRHPGQQRRHQRADRADLGVPAGGRGTGSSRSTSRRVLRLPRRRPAHARARLRAHRQRRVDRRQGRQCRASPPTRAAKAGVIGFTKSLAKELSDAGVPVNCIAPAMTETDCSRG